jgi:hypothetical protein
VLVATDAGRLLVAGMDGTLESALDAVLVLDHPLALVVAAPLRERLYERSEWLHRNDGHLLALNK